VNREGNKIRVMIFSEDGSRWRQWLVPSWAFKAVAAVTVLFMVAFGGTCTGLYYLWHQNSQVPVLREQLAHYQMEFRKMAKRLGEVENQMVRLQAFDQKLRIIANLEPPSQKGFGLRGTGGPEPFALQGKGSLLSSTDVLLGSMDEDLNKLKVEAMEQEESFVVLESFLKDQQVLLAHTPAIAPTRGWVTSGFGYRRDPFTGRRMFHEGLDIAARVGTPIVATADGVVLVAGWREGYGKTVEINHGFGYSTRYGHCSKIVVKPGQHVKRGEVIAYVGSTGRSTAPHLHYEVRIKGKPVNPYPYILVWDTVNGGSKSYAGNNPS